MKYFLALVLALAVMLAVPGVAAAQGFDVHAELGFSRSSSSITSSLPEIETALWAAGMTWHTGSWLIGLDCLERSIGIPGTIWDGALAIHTRDAYVGLAIINTDDFKLYGLAGYAANAALFQPDHFYLGFDVAGFAAGLGGQWKIGRLQFTGKVLAAPWCAASGRIGFESGGYWGELGATFDSGAVTLADLRCTLRLYEGLGVYAGCRNINTGITESGLTFSLGSDLWFTAGLCLSF